VFSDAKMNDDMNSRNTPDSDFDLDWDDKHVVPQVIFPDLEFFFDRLSEATLDAVNPRNGETVLDVGCGRANDAMDLARRGGSCLGLEPSETMICHAKREIAKDGTGVALLRGIGEDMPLKSHSFDKVVCKGALDHFPTPERAVKEMARVVKPGGTVIITVANLDCLGFRLGRTFFVRFRKLLRREESIYEKIWQTPFDHTFRFDYKTLNKMVRQHMKVDESIGISLFFASPWWGSILSRLPRPMSRGMLRMLDVLARHIPSLSDGVVLKCSLRTEGDRAR
jgi:ubiquinone/menaquinone biosynthesis C-methylase UbiE